MQHFDNSSANRADREENDRGEDIPFLLLFFATLKVLTIFP